MDLVLTKALSALAVYICALVGGLAPILANPGPRSEKLMEHGETFARGIFLGAALIHLLPEAHLRFSQVYPEVGYTRIFAACALTIVFLRLIEQGLTRYFTRQNQPKWRPYLLAVLLSIHSIIAGSALGVETDLSEFSIIFIAIVAHKSAAAFALAVNMRANKLIKNNMIKLLLLFALMTPIGILAGSALVDFSQASFSHLAAGVFNTLAAGTFIYIAAFDEDFPTPERRYPRPIQLLSFTLGVLLMAAVSIWL